MYAVVPGSMIAAPYTEIEENAFLAPGVTIANDLYPGDARSAEIMAGPRLVQRRRLV